MAFCRTLGSTRQHAARHGAALAQLIALRAAAAEAAAGGNSDGDIEMREMGAMLALVLQVGECL